jgi:hypothetical protein
MKNLALITFVTFTLLLTLNACSENSNDNAAKNDHIWKTQTDTLKQANDLADQLNKEFEKKEKQLQETQQ